MNKILNEGNQIHNFESSSGSGTTIINYGSGSTSQKVTVSTVPVPVPQRCSPGQRYWRNWTRCCRGPWCCSSLSPEARTYCAQWSLPSPKYPPQGEMIFWDWTLPTLHAFWLESWRQSSVLSRPNNCSCSWTIQRLLLTHAAHQPVICN